MTPQELAATRLLDAWDGRITYPAGTEVVIGDLDPGCPDTWIERITAAVSLDFEDIARMLAIHPDRSQAEIQHLAPRLGWIVDALANREGEPGRTRLRAEAALVAVSILRCHGAFWTALKVRPEACRTASMALEMVLRSRSAQASVPDNTPIWERETLSSLLEAEANADWGALADKARTFLKLPCLDAGASQAILGLAWLDWLRLVRIADSVGSWFQAISIFGPLSLEQAFRLAAASRSNHVRFAALERVANREVRELTEIEGQALRNLLIVLARDGGNWPGWLAVFSRYPVSHPHVQVALGRALVHCGRTGLQDYVDSVGLTTSDVGERELVTRCLREFKALAKPVRRRMLWQKAFERWQGWDFGADEDSTLAAVARSALDYAVVGWLVEGDLQLDGRDLDRMFENDLRALELQWHRSFAVASSGFYRLLSRHQVWAHAAAISRNGVDWLPGPVVRVPAAATDDFVQRRYRWTP